MELAILIDCFVPKQTLTSRMNAGALRVFDKIGKLAGTEVIYTLKAGDSFVFDGVTYDVLWPPRDRYPFDPACTGVSQEINAILQTQSHQRIQAFLELKEELWRRLCPLHGRIRYADRRGSAGTAGLRRGHLPADPGFGRDDPSPALAASGADHCRSALRTAVQYGLQRRGQRRQPDFS